MTKTFTTRVMILLCLAAGLLPVARVTAQTSGGPDAYGYIWRDSNDPNGPVYNWIDIASSAGAIPVTGLADDNVRGPYTIGFPFHFYWYDVTTFRVGSNGYIAFGLGAAAHPFPVIPNPSGLQNFIAPFMADLTFTDANGATPPGTSCWYWVSSGNDSLIISYLNVPFWDPNPNGYVGSNSFQIILSNVDSSITFQYQSQTGVYQNPTNFCTVGIENISGNVGLQHSHDILPPAVYAIKYYYPSSTTFQVNDASTVYNNNETTGGLFLSNNGAPYVMKAQVKNTGNQPLASFNVMSRVVNFLNQNQAVDNLATSPLVPGATEDLVFTNTFSPTTTGTYRHITNTQLTGDATPSNNAKELELQVVDTTQASIKLSFDSGIDAGLGGLSWLGGGGGAGMEFIPPFYPCNVTQLSAFVAANANLAGFAMLVLDDDGPGGTPLTVLDSVWVNGPNVLVGNWNFVPTTAPITIDSGSFYVAWMMGGDGISLGQNQVLPISNRTFEVLGQASNPIAWADYRYREIEDLMINAYIEDVPVGLSEPDSRPMVGNVYPNPSSQAAYIDYRFPAKAASLTWSLFDMNGKRIAQGHAGNHVTSGTVQIQTGTLGNGIYQVTLDTGKETYTRRLSVVK